MKVVISRPAAVEIRPEESRGDEDLVGPAQLAVLALQHHDPFALLCRQAAPGVAIDFGLVDPPAQGLGADAELPCDPAHRAEPLTSLAGGPRTIRTARPRSSGGYRRWVVCVLCSAMTP